ncbi:unnamed protein product [Cylicocyclus nassatus]|uniref:Carboxylic ester hydrolase n=1 Tax=Cylicocyclus nassatus TaxID=53992 RepID=A0AA36GJZ3_CYLNA|nr:unnamed protein product [Cylicocyclus nassatus]
MSNIFKFLLFTTLALISTAQRVNVTISTGTISGLQVKAKSGKLVNIFKHIPYAAPPVGDLRFQKAQAPEKWDGIRDATEYGPACISNSSITKSPQKWIDEDCLHVNIFAGANCMENLCPVAFYIHGGSFNYDSAVMFKDELLVNNFGANDVVLVIPGFRLGFFGLLTFGSDDVVPRNIGAHDILAALHFVKNEIKNFGGNPDDITLFGHSGGATTAAQFALSKQIDPDQKLFQKSVMMSMSFGFTDATHMQNLTMELAYRAKCIPSRTADYNSVEYVERVVKCLRNLDSMEILRIQRQMEDEDEWQKPEFLIMTAPLFDAKDLQEFLANPKPRTIMTGTTLREMDDTNDPVEYNIVEFLGIKNRKEILKRFYNDRASNRLSFNHSSSTQAMFLSSYVIGHKIREAGGKTFLYSYANPRHPMHTDDLSYIMGVHQFEPDENEAVLADLYPKFFTDFIKFGQPRQDWTPLQPRLDNYMRIDVNLKENIMPHMDVHYETEVIKYWESLIEYDELITLSKTEVKRPHAVVGNVPETSSHGNDTFFLFYLLLPLCAVVIAALLVRCMVYRRRAEIDPVTVRSEKTPLLS